MPVVVFDMDDTLYDEMSYVRSGFNEVAQLLFNQFGCSKEECVQILDLELSKHGRGKLFDHLLQYLGFYSKKMVQKCISVYRMHDPAIQLYPDSIDCLSLLKSLFPLYLVTDGNKIVQSKKVNSLKLNEYMMHCYITHRYGRDQAKPSPYVFHRICEKENVSPENVIYVGDNPNKDFVGIKAAGFRTVRIMRGGFSHIEKPINYEADYRIQSLHELTPDFIRAISK